MSDDNKQNNVSIRIERRAVRLLDLRPGLFVDPSGVVGFKPRPQCDPDLMAKFLRDPALIDVFCVDGEKYWGGTESTNDRAALWVYPASICEFNTQADAEPSVGSHADAWMVVSPTTEPIDATVNRAVAEGWGKWGHGHGLVPLYRSPTLTDEERAAIQWAINKTAPVYDDYEGGPIKREAMRHLLRRTK
jgi:hypothetical protein